MEMYKDPSWTDVAPDDGEPITCHFDRIFQRITDFQGRVVKEYKQAVGTRIKMVVANPMAAVNAGELQGQGGAEAAGTEVVSHTFENAEEKL